MDEDKPVELIPIGVASKEFSKYLRDRFGPGIAVGHNDRETLIVYLPTSDRRMAIPLVNAGYKVEVRYGATPVPM